jgi:hypothetical protein
VDMDAYPFTIGVVECFQLHDVGMPDDPHNLQLAILNIRLAHIIPPSDARGKQTLNLLSWRTRLIAASSPDGESLVWKTTPKDPLPTILH